MQDREKSVLLFCDIVTLKMFSENVTYIKSY